MSPLAALWIASVVGASLFFASGVLSAGVVYRLLGLRPRPAPSVAGSAGEPLAGSATRGTELAEREQRWLTELSQAQVLAQDARREAEMLREQLEVELANRTALDDEIGETHARLDEATRRANETQKSAALVPGLKKRLDELEHIHQVRGLRLEMLGDRIVELETYADESVALRGERDALKTEVDRLRRSAREALARSVTPPLPSPGVHVEPVGVAHVRRPSQSGTTLRVRAPVETLEASLTQSLSSLVEREPGMIVVLSDHDGFPVAGLGNERQQETVSVLTALAQELAFRVKEFVDLERIERMELADATGRALRVRFFDWQTQPLALACLGKRSLVESPDEERVVSAFPQLLQRWSA